VAARGEHDQRLAHIGLAKQARIVHRLQHDADVVGMVEHSPHDFARVGHVHADAQARVPRAQHLHDAHHVVRPDRAQPQVALVVYAGVEQQLHGLLFAPVDAVAHLVQQAAEFGERDAAPASVEQLHAELLLEPGDMFRDRRLAQAKQLARRRHAAAACGGVEGAQLG
jgi:hypothetical protein